MWPYVVAFLLLGPLIWAGLVMADPGPQTAVPAGANFSQAVMTAGSVGATGLGESVAFTVDRAGVATLAVTRTEDSDDGVCDAHCSLREAIAVASSGDAIDIPAGTYTLTLGSELAIDEDLTLAGAGAQHTIVQAAISSGDATSRVLNITSGNVAISGVTIRHGNSSGDGGGIRNLGTLAVTDSTISDNSSRFQGGGINNWGRLTVTNSTVSGNTSGVGSEVGLGGGIQNTGTLTLTNSTVSGNTAGGGNGGGISNASSGSELTVTNGTITGNVATLPGGGVFNFGAVTLINTIVANNSSGGDCYGTVTRLGSISSLGHNLDNDGSCELSGPGDLSDTDPLLGPLRDNGGPTFTHALRPGSRAIDAGDDTAAPLTDQRGVRRPQGRDSDIGAYEFEPPAFTVDSTGDGKDSDTTDGACDDGTGRCTLRAAIEQANARLGPDVITFNIAGVGPHTIRPGSSLPAITDPVIIDGYTQPGSSPNTNGPGLGSNAMLMIELNGTSAGFGADGLSINGGSSIVRGLVINRFRRGIWLPSDNNLVQGSFIGTDLTGALDLGNSNSGVYIGAASDNVIGGTAAGARNVISGNNNAGVSIVSGSTRNTVHGNFIGTDRTGTLAVGNRFDGVEIEGSPNNVIGGTTAGARNVLSGNHSGIYIGRSGATGNLVQGNFIGTDVTGTAALGNIGDGVEFRDADGNTIGGSASNARNTIAFNGGDGVAVFSGADNAILSNSIFSNVGLGIDLIPDGVTPNDAGDGDTGANELQNFPVLTSATSSGDRMGIEGNLNSAPNTSFRLEFFSNSTCDPSSHWEGEKLLGSTTVATAGGGSVDFTVFFPTTVPAGHFITATATDPKGNTSEFSQCAEVGAGVVNRPPSADDQTVTADGESQVVIALTASDLDDDSLSFVITTLPGSGDLAEGGTSITTVPHALAGDTVTYVPDAGFIGGDSFTFKVSDGTHESGTAAVVVNVVEALELAESPWPMFRHDPQRTGRSRFSGPEAPIERWRFVAGGQVRSSPAIGADGTIYVGSDDNRLYAISRHGSLKWSFLTGGPVESSAAVGDDGTIYIGSLDGNVYAIGPNGTESWTFPTGSGISSSPVIGPGGIIYINSGGVLYAINPDGTEKWTFSIGQSLFSFPAIGADGTIYVGGQIFVGYGSWPHVFAINPDGTRQWALISFGGMPFAPAVGSDGTIYVSLLGDTVQAISPGGTTKWEFRTGGVRFTSSPAIGADGTIYVGARENRLYAINPDGTERWRFATSGRVESSPAVGADGTIYFGSGEDTSTGLGDNRVYALNPDGSEKWAFETGGEVGSSPAVGHDGAVYVGSEDGTLYAIGEQATLDGDVNADGRVNREDLRVVAANLGTKPPADYRADVNGDGRVDISDLVEVAKNFGRTAP